MAKMVATCAGCEKSITIKQGQKLIVEYRDGKPKHYFHDRICLGLYKGALYLPSNKGN